LFETWGGGPPSREEPGSGSQPGGPTRTTVERHECCAAPPSSTLHSSLSPPNLPIHSQSQTLAISPSRAQVGAMAQLPDELVREILLRVTPDDPACLLRAAVVYSYASAGAACSPTPTSAAVTGSYTRRPTSAASSAS
jgi:hypothetical protein